MRFTRPVRPNGARGSARSRSRSCRGVIGFAFARARGRPQAPVVRLELLGAGRRAAARGNRLVRPEAARAPAARLGNASLRPVLAAPGPGLRAPGDSLAIRQRSVLRGHPSRHDALATPAAALLSR